METTKNAGHRERWLLMGAVVAVLVLLFNIAAPVRSSVQGQSSQPSFSDDFNDNLLSPDWTVFGGSWSESGQVMSIGSTPSVSSKQLILTGDSFGADLTITAKVRVNTWAENNTDSRAGVSLFTGTGDGLGYSLLFARNHSTVRFLDGAQSWGPMYTFPWTSGTWYWFKLKMEAGVLSGKIWQDGSAEPAAWPFTWARSGRSGYPALYGGRNSASTASFDNVTVAGNSAAPAPTSTPLSATATPAQPVHTPTSTLSPTATAPAAATQTATTTAPVAPTASGVSVYVDGYGGNVFTSEDNMLHSGAPTINFGGHNVYDVSTIRKFIQRFNLSAIPANATPLSATVTYYKTSAVPNREVIVTIYSVSQANGDWREGAQYGGTARAGDSSWNLKNASGAPWAGSPGLSTSGVDYEPAVIGSFVIPANAQVGAEFVCHLDLVRVAGWFGANNTNYGILMVASGAAEYIGSSENTNPAYRPKLVVQYRANNP